MSENEYGGVEEGREEGHERVIEVSVEDEMKSSYIDLSLIHI